MIIGWASKRSGKEIWERGVKGKRGRGTEEHGVRELF
jgi:hypothetical protein